nr:transposase [Ructibacterium gallinarum]
MTTRQISAIIEKIYSFEVNKSMVTSVSNKILLQIEEWQNRPYLRYIRSFSLRQSIFQFVMSLFCTHHSWRQ